MNPPEAPSPIPDDPSAGSRAGGMLGAAIFWSTLNFIFSYGSGIIVLLIIASQLPPSVFGIIALATIASDFIAIEGRFAAMDAIIQAGRFDKPYLSSAFLSLLIIIALISTGLILASPYVSAAYEAPLVASFMPVFSLMLLPIPWVAVMDALMMRDLHYRQQTQRSIAATLSGGIVGVAVAFSPWGVWAIAAQRVVALTVQTVMLYAFTRWRPRLDFEPGASVDFTRRFFALWTVNTLVVSISRITLLVFGLRYDVVTAGLLRASNRITEAVQGPVIAPLQGIWFPLMSKVRGDVAAEREIYNNIIRTASVTSLPAFSGLALTAPDLVSVILPPQYAGVTPVLQASSVTMLLIPVLWFNNVAMASIRLNRLSLAYTITLVVTSLIALYLSHPLSAPEAILAMSVPAAIVGMAGNIILNNRLLQSNLAYYKSLLPAIVASGVMSATVAVLISLLAASGPWIRLIACGFVGVTVYAGWLLLFHRQWSRNCLHTLTGGRRRLG